jgi:hypothetical protein
LDVVNFIAMASRKNVLEQVNYGNRMTENEEGAGKENRRPSGDAVKSEQLAKERQRSIAHQDEQVIQIACAAPRTQPRTIG